MRATFDKILAQIKEFLSGLSAKERNRLIVLAVLIIGLSITAAWLLGRTVWVPLEAGLTPAVAGQHKAAIDEMGYTSRLADGGTTIEVPEKDRSAIWVGLNTQGIVGPSNLSPDLYGNYLSQLGATDRDKSAAQAWQTQDWLRTVFMGMDGIDDAQVIISVGEKSTSILQSANPPTASIMVRTSGNTQLSDSQVQTIVNYAAGAWDGLTADNITLADMTGILYDTTGGGVDNSVKVAERLSLENQIRSTIERQLNNLFVPVVGTGNLRVTASVKLDWDDTTIQSVTFAPPVDGMDEGLKVSLYRLWESSSYGDAAGGVPGTDTNGMGTVEYPYLDLEEDEYYRKYIEEANYELNETREEIVKAKGTIQQLTVSVLVNSDAVAEDYTATFSELTATALGIDNNDKTITVAQLPFTPVAEPEPEGFWNQTTTNLLELAIKAVVVLLLGLAIISFLRSLFKVGKKEQLVLADGTGMSIDYVAEGDMEGLELDELLGEEGEEGAPPLAEIDLRAKDGSLLQLEDFIDRDPEAVVQLLRNWLSED